MAWGFERGRVYNRRRDIHGRFGGQQQGGIITPADHRLVIIITGEEGAAHGYSDRWRPDGVFEYFGEGQVGDMIVQKGNKAIARHSANGKSLLLFRKTRDGLVFEDEMVCEGYHREDAPDRDRNIRSALVFELRPLSSVEEGVEAADPVRTDLATLRARAFAASREAPARAETRLSVFERSREVRDYVIARAEGDCEGCKQPAPFLRANGTPYLEPHHIDRLTDGGPDNPRLVIALCPNCHRRVHSGADGANYNDALRAKMSTIEP